MGPCECRVVGRGGGARMRFKDEDEDVGPKKAHTLSLHCLSPLRGSHTRMPYSVPADTSTLACRSMATLYTLSLCPSAVSAGSPI